MFDLRYYCVLKVGSGHHAMTISEIANIIMKQGPKVIETWLNREEEVIGFSTDQVFVKSESGTFHYSAEDFSCLYLTKSGSPFRKLN